MCYLVIVVFYNNIMVEYVYGIFLLCKNGLYLKYYDLNKVIYWMKLVVVYGYIEVKIELLRLEELK